MGSPRGRPRAGDGAMLVDLLERDGYAAVDRCLDPGAVDALVRGVAELSAPPGPRGADGAYGSRDLLSRVPMACAVAASPAVRGLVEPVLGPAARLVRGLFFDKTPAANWPLRWHQDRTIAVRQHVDARGWGPWSVKEGRLHVQPPVPVLAGMLAVRLHLDDCGPDNGPLRVLPGTHREGLLDRVAIDERRRRILEVVCIIPASGALLLRPLLLHASSPAVRPGHRRVVHLEFAAGGLPDGLEWARG